MPDDPLSPSASGRGQPRRDDRRAGAPEITTVNLAESAKAIVPVMTPLVNLLPRAAGTGSDVVHWKGVRGLTARAARGPHGELLVDPDLCMMSAEFTPVVVTLANDPHHIAEDGQAEQQWWRLLLYQHKIVEERTVISALLAQATAENGTTVRAPHRADGVWSLADLDDLLAEMRARAGADPTYLVVDPFQHQHFTRLVQGSDKYDAAVLGPGYLDVPYRVTHYINRTTQTSMGIIIERYLPADTLLALTTEWPATYLERPPSPFWRLPHRDTPEGPVSVREAFGNPIEIEVNQDYLGLEVPADHPGLTDPPIAPGRLAILADEVVKLRYPGGVGVLSGLAIPAGTAPSPDAPAISS